MSRSVLAVATGLLATTVSAAFDAGSTKNIAMYWGQGSDQIPLSQVCADPTIDIVNIGFVNGFPQNVGDYPKTNFANACWGYYPDPHDSTKDSEFLQNCPGVADAITACQTAGKKVLLSLGGGYPTNYYLPNQEVAEYFAEFLQSAFGPKKDSWTGPRPFGDAAVDGFDLDLEAEVANVPSKEYLYLNYDFLVTRLKALRSSTLISAAPQCEVPDARLAYAIERVPFDYIFTQFYNTEACAAVTGYKQLNQGSTTFSFDAWVKYLQTYSKNKAVKLYLGLAAGPDGLPTHKDHYLKPEEANQLIVKYQKKYPTIFGGVMLWEATVSVRNPTYGKSFGYWMKAVLDGRFTKEYKPVVSSSSRAVSSTRVSSTRASSTRVSSTRASSTRVSSSKIASSTKVASSSAYPTSSAKSSSVYSVAPSSSVYSVAPSSSVYSVKPSSSVYSVKPSSTEYPVSSSAYPVSSEYPVSSPSPVSSEYPVSSSVYVPHPSETSSVEYPAVSPSIVYPADTTKVIPSASKSDEYPAVSTPCTTSSVEYPAVSSSAEYPEYPASSKEYPETPAASSSVEYPEYPAKSSSVEYPETPAASSSAEYPEYPESTPAPAQSTPCTTSSKGYPAASSSAEYPEVPVASSKGYPEYPAESSKGYPEVPVASSKGYPEYPVASSKGYPETPVPTKGYPEYPVASPSVTKKVEYSEYPSKPTDTITTITTTYVDVCSTGLTTVTTTITKTVCGKCAKPTKEADYPEDWTTSVYVDKTVTVTITKPIHPATDVPAYPTATPDVYPTDYETEYPEKKPEYPVEKEEYSSKAEYATLTTVSVKYTPVPYASAPAPAPYVPAGNGTSAYVPYPTGTGKPTKPTSYSPTEFEGAASRFGVGLTAIVAVVAGVLVL
ncbi:glycoside hydrolase [Pyrenochaeta sp. DS3sAY3a]|nr:glycoside hydrolase [Pyrenochaeta sp. DS3sAY3a]